MTKTYPLDREWLHIQIIENELYVFTDDGHWKDTVIKGDQEEPLGLGGKVDWDSAITVTFEDLDKECFVGWIDSAYTSVRIPLNRKVLYGKFGMPYFEELS